MGIATAKTQSLGGAIEVGHSNQSKTFRTEKPEILANQVVDSRGPASMGPSEVSLLGRLPHFVLSTTNFVQGSHVIVFAAKEVQLYKRSSTDRKITQKEALFGFHLPKC